MIMLSVCSYVSKPRMVAQSQSAHRQEEDILIRRTVPGLKPLTKTKKRNRKPEAAEKPHSQATHKAETKGRHLLKQKRLKLSVASSTVLTADKETQICQHEDDFVSFEQQVTLRVKLNRM